MILEKDTIRTIEDYFKNYDSKTEQLEILTEDIIYGKSTGYMDGSRGNAISDKTFNSAVDLIEKKTHEKEKWLEVVSETIKRFENTEYEGVFNLTYIEQYRLPKILRILAMERSAYYDRKNDIIMYAALKATEKGLIRH